MKPGRYETTYGNTAILTSATAKTAMDIDMGGRVPVALLDPNSWKPLLQKK